MIGILILTFIILILLLFLKNKENFNINKDKNENKTANNDYKIVLFFTGGLCEEAQNCIQTIENVGLKNKLLVHTLDKESYTCVKDRNLEIKRVKTNLKHEAEFGSKDFYEIMFNKLKIIRKCLADYKQIIVYSDTDIVFLKDISKDIDTFAKSNYDIMIQDDSAVFKHSDNLCAGFMMFKPNNKCIRCLELAMKIMKDNWDTHDKLAVGGGADQRAINLAIKQTKIKFGRLDLKEYPNGARYFSNTNTVYNHFVPKIIHNNYIVGTKNKIERFKKHKLWFV